MNKVAGCLLLLFWPVGDVHTIPLLRMRVIKMYKQWTNFFWRLFISNNRIFLIFEEEYVNKESGLIIINIYFFIYLNLFPSLNRCIIITNNENFLSDCTMFELRRWHFKQNVYRASIKYYFSENYSTLYLFYKRII